MRSEEKICKLEFCDYYEDGYCTVRIKKSKSEQCPDLSINGETPFSNSGFLFLDEVHKKYDPTHKDDE